MLALISSLVLASSAAGVELLILVPHHAPDPDFEEPRLRAALDLYFSDVDYSIRSTASSDPDEPTARAVARGTGATYVVWFRWKRTARGWSVQAPLASLSSADTVPMKTSVNYPLKPKPEIYRVVALKLRNALRAELLAKTGERMPRLGEEEDAPALEDAQADAIAEAPLPRVVVELFPFASIFAARSARVDGGATIMLLGEREWGAGVAISYGAFVSGVPGARALRTHLVLGAPPLWRSAGAGLSLAPEASLGGLALETAAGDLQLVPAVGGCAVLRYAWSQRFFAAARLGLDLFLARYPEQSGAGDRVSPRAEAGIGIRL